MSTMKSTLAFALEVGPFARSLRALKRLQPDPNLTLLDKAIVIARKLRGWDDEKHGDWRFAVAAYAVLHGLTGRDSYILLAKALGVTNPKRAAELGALIRKCACQNLDTVRAKILKAGGVKKVASASVELPVKKVIIRRASRKG